MNKNKSPDWQGVIDSIKWAIITATIFGSLYGLTLFSEIH